MVAEADERLFLPLLIQAIPDECEICGSSHELEKCNLVESIVENVTDNPTLSYARLTLPEGLEVRELIDGTKTVVTTKSFRKGVQFGPFIAKTSTLMDVRIDFPLKLFLCEDQSVYLETYEELFCNWMCLVLPATNSTEQNLLCYQVKNSIYFCTSEEIKQGQELRVWYSPFYADKMGVQVFSNQTQLHPDLDEEFQEIFSSLENGVNEKDLSRLIVTKKKRRRKRPEPPLLGDNYYQAVPANDLLPGELLGVKVKRSEWECKVCEQVETCVSAFARHLMTHYKSEGKGKFNCPYCPRYFRKDGYNRTLHIDYCKKKNEATVRAKSSSNSELASEPIAQTMPILVYLQAGPNNLNNQNTSFPITESDKASIESFISNLSIENEDNNPYINCSVSNKSKGQESEGAKDINNIMEQSIKNKETENYQNENDKVDERISKESLGHCELNTEEKRIWKDDSKLFENEKNNVCMDALNENLLTKSHLNTPILDLSDDIDFSITKSFTEMINEDCNLDKSMTFSKTGRSLDLFAGVRSSSLLSNEVSMSHSSSLEQSSFYSLNKSEFLHSSFNSCEDVTDEEKYRIVENLLSETEDKFLGSDYDMTDGCTSDNPQSESVNVDGQKNNIDKLSQDKSKDQNDFICDICEKSFKKQEYLYRHLYKHTGSFRCNYCFMVFARNETLLKHKLSCKTEAATRDCVTRFIAPCPFCKLQFQTLTALQQHINTHYCEGDAWVCACEKILNDASLIGNHNCPFEAISVSCVNCSKVFCSAEDFIRHKVFPKKPTQFVRRDQSLVCEVCGLMFKSHSAMTTHRRSHGDRKYECEICSKKFLRCDSLNLHRQRHGQPMWECPVCKKLFQSKAIYRNHHKSIHAPYSFKCQYCEKTFRQKGNMKKHLKTHEPAKDFKCGVCEVQFKSKDSLDNHSLLHTKGETFKCEICDHLFLMKGQLRTHVRRAHTDMYSCAYCHMDIRYRHTLKKHLNAKHKDKSNEWDSVEALKKMQKNKEPGSAEKITCNPCVVDILQTAAGEILETEQLQSNGSTLAVQVNECELDKEYYEEESTGASLSKEQLISSDVTSSDVPLHLITLNIGTAPGNDGRIQLVHDNMQEAVITLPLNVLENFPISSGVEANQSTFLKDLTINLAGSSSQGDCEMVTNMDSAMLSAPLQLTEDYQLIDGTQLDKQIEEDSSSLIDINSIQDVDIDGTSAFIVSDGSIMDPNTSDDQNMIFYIIETPGADLLT